MKYQVKTLHVNVPGHEYDILIGAGILGDAAEYIKAVASPSKILIVTDETVNPLYGDAVETSLKTLAETRRVVLPAGETTKSMEYLNRLYDEAFAFSMTRKDLVVALGGGVIGDLAGFFASTLLRGVDIIQIPTTLLSQVDSSVGGKTAIDVPQGKNLVGTFYQPKQVFIDTDTLLSLSDREFFGGFAEVIKYGAIWDEAFFEMLEKAPNRADIMENIEEIVYRCCDIKREIVEIDEHDTALRMILNFGHTVGHIVEKAYHYTGFVHGEAVAFGMTVAAKIGETLEITEKGTAKTLTKFVKKCGLPTDISVSEEEFLGLALDKKTSGNEISVILLEKIGTYRIHKMEVLEFIKICKSILNQ